MAQPKKTRRKPGNYPVRPAPRSKDGAPKSAGEAIARLEIERRRLNLAMEGGQIGPWAYDLGQGTAFWSDTLYELLGRDAERPVTPETFLEYVHPDDRPRIGEHVERWRPRAASSRRSSALSARTDRCGGRLLAGGGTTTSDRPLRAVGVNYDITGRKETLEPLRHSAEELRHRNEELERLNKVAAGRELRMIELKKEINELLAAAGRPARYNVHDDGQET